LEEGLTLLAFYIAGLCEYHHGHAHDSFHNAWNRRRGVESYALGSSDNMDSEKWYWNDREYTVCMVEWVMKNIR